MCNLQLCVSVYPAGTQRCFNVHKTFFLILWTLDGRYFDVLFLLGMDLLDATSTRSKASSVWSKFMIDDSVDPV